MAKRLGRPSGKSGDRLEIYLPRELIVEARQIALNKGLVITQGRQKGQGNLSKLILKLLQREQLIKSMKP